MHAAYKKPTEAATLKYRICYKKTADMVYISHLDLQRMFQRAFKRAGIMLEFSQGFNPHPKMTYSPPLPLFAKSEEEYIDIDVVNEFDLDTLKSVLPQGIIIKYAEKLNEDSLALSELINTAEYSIKIFTSDKTLLLTALKNTYEQSENLIIEKLNKKKKKIQKDILPSVKDAIFSLDNNCVQILCELKAKNDELLNPFVFITALLEKAGIDTDEIDLEVTKTRTFV